MIFRASATSILVFVVIMNSALGQDLNMGPVPLTAELRERCRTELRRVLNGDQFWPAMHAAEALTLLGDKKAVLTTLPPRLMTENDHQKRCGLAREIARTGQRDSLKVLWEILEDEHSKGRVHAAESLYKIAEVGDGRLLRKIWKHNNDPRLQIMCAAALGRAGNTNAIKQLREHVASSDSERRKLAVWILGLIGETSDIELIRNVLHDEIEPTTRAFLVHAMACLGDEEGRTELGRNLSSADAAVRTYAAEFAGYSRCVELHSRLVELLDDPLPDVRVRAAQSLIALSLPPGALGLPIAHASEDFQVDVYPATEENPRYSEGSILALRDGSLLYATTEFANDSEDHSTASIVARNSTDGGHSWGEQRRLQENIARQNVMSVTLRRMPSGDDDAALGMFFLVKNGPSDLKVYVRISQDEGETFGESIVVTPAPGYHVINNDRVAMLSNGRLVCPVAWTGNVVAGGHFVAMCYLSNDGGHTWRPSADRLDQPKRGAMEPEVVELSDGRLLMIMRTQLGYIATSISEDGGDHWSASSQLPLQAPEAPATIRTIPSTGDLVLIWNNTYRADAGHGGKRTPLSAAISSDEGKTWRITQPLETAPDLEFAYTSMLFHKDRALLSYYVHDERTGRISSRFRSLPVHWFTKSVHLPE